MPSPSIPLVGSKGQPVSRSSTPPRQTTLRQSPSSKPTRGCLRRCDHRHLPPSRGHRVPLWFRGGLRRPRRRYLSRRRDQPHCLSGVLPPRNEVATLAFDVNLDLAIAIDLNVGLGFALDVALAPETDSTRRAAATLLFDVQYPTDPRSVQTPQTPVGRTLRANQEVVKERTTLLDIRFEGTVDRPTTVVG